MRISTTNAFFISIIAIISIFFVSHNVFSAENRIITKCPFYRDLTMGDSGEDVLCLQKSLNSLGIIIANSGPGSIGNETRYFGELTRQAVIVFQELNEVSPAVGYFGVKTRAVYDNVFKSIGQGQWPFNTDNLNQTVNVSDRDDENNDEDFDITCRVSDTSAKVGDEINFSIDIDGGRSPYKYEWSGDIGEEDGDKKTLNVEYNKIGKYKVKIEVRDKNKEVDSDICDTISIASSTTDVSTASSTENSVASTTVDYSETFKLTKDTHTYDDMDQACKDDYGKDWEFARINDEEEEYILSGKNGKSIFSDDFIIANIPSSGYPFEDNICSVELNPCKSWPEPDKVVLFDLKSNKNVCYSDLPNTTAEYQGLCRTPVGSSPEDSYDIYSEETSTETYVYNIDNIISSTLSGDEAEMCYGQNNSTGGNTSNISSSSSSTSNSSSNSGSSVNSSNSTSSNYSSSTSYCKAEPNSRGCSQCKKDSTSSGCTYCLKNPGATVCRGW